MCIISFLKLIKFFEFEKKLIPLIIIGSIEDAKELNP